MERLTKQQNGEAVLLNPDAINEAIRRLAVYETMHEELAALYAVTEQELEKLRAQGKQTSGKFRELVARKLIHKSILDQIEAR